MHVEQTDGILTVKIAPKEILQMLESRRIRIQDVELLCSLIYQIGVAKRQKKSFAAITSRYQRMLAFDRLVKADSINMCLQLVEHAGISKKGLGAVHITIRRFSGAIIKNGIASDVKNDIIWLTWLPFIRHCSGLVDRANRVGREFIKRIGAEANTWAATESVLRIGLLILAGNNDPEFMLELKFQMIEKE